ncbi:MAG: hypothetical protein K2G85_08570 [Muribaculaceae bacterium]|nr:hypothetical protein [Muribaculaceae bacterium]
MKPVRLLVVIWTSIVVSFSSWAGEPGKGYRGFVDANVDLQFKQDDYYGGTTTTVSYGISTSHGYQFNPHFFLGAGLMFERIYPDPHDFLVRDFPIFIHARTDWKIGELPLYGDLRAGGVIFGEYRIFISPTVGYRLNLGRKSNLNFGIGMNLRGCSWTDEKTFHPELAIRVGVDF